eukprot:2482304-Heterocapsa_arctica.AAC.1
MEADRDVLHAVLLAAGIDIDKAAKLLQQQNRQPGEDQGFITPNKADRLAGSPPSASDSLAIKTTSPRPVSWSLH